MDSKQFSRRNQFKIEMHNSGISDVMNLSVKNLDWQTNVNKLLSYRPRQTTAAAEDLQEALLFVPGDLAASFSRWCCARRWRRLPPVPLEASEPISKA